MPNEDLAGKAHKMVGMMHHVGHHDARLTQPLIDPVLASPVTATMFAQRQGRLIACAC